MSQISIFGKLAKLSGFIEIICFLKQAFVCQRAWDPSFWPPLGSLAPRIQVPEVSESKGPPPTASSECEDYFSVLGSSLTLSIIQLCRCFAPNTDQAVSLEARRWPCLLGSWLKTTREARMLPRKDSLVPMMERAWGLTVLRVGPTGC